MATERTSDRARLAVSSDTFKVILVHVKADPKKCSRCRQMKVKCVPKSKGTCQQCYNRAIECVGREPTEKEREAQSKSKRQRSETATSSDALSEDSDESKSRRRRWIQAVTEERAIEKGYPQHERALIEADAAVLLAQAKASEDAPQVIKRQPKKSTRGAASSSAIQRGTSPSPRQLVLNSGRNDKPSSQTAFQPLPERQVIRNSAALQSSRPEKLTRKHTKSFTPVDQSFLLSQVGSSPAGQSRQSLPPGSVVPLHSGPLPHAASAESFPDSSGAKFEPLVPRPPSPSVHSSRPGPVRQTGNGRSSLPWNRAVPAGIIPRCERTELRIRYDGGAGFRPFDFPAHLDSATLLGRVLGAWALHLTSLESIEVTYKWLEEGHPARRTILDRQEDFSAMRQMFINDIPKTPRSDSFPYVIELTLYRRNTAAKALMSTE